MNQLMVMLSKKKRSNLPKVGQFGKLLEHLSACPEVNAPPTHAEFNVGLNVVHVNSPLCGECLKKELDDAGFDTVVGHTREEYHDCPNHKVVATQ